MYCLSMRVGEIAKDCGCWLQFQAGSTKTRAWKKNCRLARKEHRRYDTSKELVPEWVMLMI